DRDAPDVYTVQLILDIAGALDDQRLHAAADAVVQRHHNLRASFHHDGLPQPVQVIAGDVHAQWRDVDLSADADPRAASAALVERDRLERFDQTTGPLIRFTHVRLSGAQHVLVLTHHHVLMDGWSTPLLVAELMQLYRSGGDAAALAPVRPYADFLDWLARQDR